ncbi:MAG: efflux RND transporter periplasmic adaptor subunit [Bacteroidota bacterium]
MKKSTYIIAVLCTLLLSVSCQETTSEKNDEHQHNEEEHQHDERIKITKKQFNFGDFEFGSISEQSFSNRFRVTGKVDVPPNNRAFISPYFPGYISQNNLLVGDVVQKGALLFRLRNPEFIQIQEAFLSTSSEFEFQEKEYERKQNLHEQKSISDKVFQRTKSDFQQTKAKLTALEQTLKMMNIDKNSVLNGNFTDEIAIYAPINGKISKVNVASGSYVEKQNVLMEIVDTDHIHLELDVFEKDLSKINEGDSLRFRIPEMSSKEFPAYVRLVGAEVTENRNLRIHAHPLTEEHSFSVGMFVEAFFDENKVQKLALPTTAFIEIDEEWHVLLLEKETDSAYFLKPIEVKKSMSYDGFRVLESDFDWSENQRFLIQGGFDLIEEEGGGHSH